MFWISLFLALFGPLLGELVKRIVLKLIPKLPVAERSAARKELVAVIKSSVKKDPAAVHGYAVSSPEAHVEGRLQALEAKLMQRIAAGRA